MNPTRVLVSGASIAGPALAHWLTGYGYDVTVVELADGIRPGGQAVDFKGATHRTVLTRMGIWEELQAMQTHAGDGVLVDAEGRRIGVVPAAFSGGDIEVPRGDIAQLLYERTKDSCTYLFGDSITALAQDDDGVTVTFAHAEAQRFDLVVGADGIHSNVRRLTFGPEQDFVRHLGYHYALATIDGDFADEMYNEPGRMAATGGPKAPAFFVFASPPLGLDRRDTEAQKRALSAAYAGAGWRVPELLAAIEDADDFYLDAVCRAGVDTYAHGRVVLLGDSAWGNTLGGFGTGLAIVGAYVLAGELHRAQGDHERAFASYERLFLGYAKVAEKVNAGQVLAPRSRAVTWLRNRVFTVAVLFVPLMRLFERFATDIDLPDYAQPLSAGSGGTPAPASGRPAS